MGDETSSQSLQICRDIDAIWCSCQAARFAEDIGFGFKEVWAIAIAVSELTTNVVKFAKTGTLILCRVEPPRPGIQITVEDEGPGIDDIDAALIDGYSEGRLLFGDGSTRGGHGLGAGLGAVRRLMDEVEIENRPEGGVRITAHKWLEE